MKADEIWVMGVRARRVEFPMFEVSVVGRFPLRRRVKPTTVVDRVCRKAELKVIEGMFESMCGEGELHPLMRVLMGVAVGVVGHHLGREEWGRQMVEVALLDGGFRLIEEWKEEVVEEGVDEGVDEVK